MTNFDKALEKLERTQENLAKKGLRMKTVAELVAEKEEKGVDFKPEPFVKI